MWNRSWMNCVREQIKKKTRLDEIPWQNRITTVGS